MTKSIVVEFENINTNIRQEMLNILYIVLVIIGESLEEIPEAYLKH